MQGYSERVKLKHFRTYCQTEGQRDDSPLYIFDSRFGDKDTGKALRRDYPLPFYFQEDLFKLVGERRRPPYRWFMMGAPLLPFPSPSTINMDSWETVLSPLSPSCRRVYPLRSRSTHSACHCTPT